MLSSAQGRRILQYRDRDRDHPSRIALNCPSTLSAAHIPISNAANSFIMMTWVNVRPLRTSHHSLHSTSTSALVACTSTSTPPGGLLFTSGSRSLVVPPPLVFLSLSLLFRRESNSFVLPNLAFLLSCSEPRGGGGSVTSRPSFSLSRAIKSRKAAIDFNRLQSKKMARQNGQAKDDCYCCSVMWIRHQRDKRLATPRA